MGKGDRKTKKGKISMGSFGKRRPRKGNQTNFVAQPVQPDTDRNTMEATKANAPKAEKSKKTAVKKKTTTKAAKSKA